MKMCWRYIFSAAIFCLSFILDINIGFFIVYLRCFHHYKISPEKEIEIRKLAKSVGMINSDKLTVLHSVETAACGIDETNGYPVIFINKFVPFKEFDILHEIGHIVNGDCPTKLFLARNDKSYIIRFLFVIAVLGNSLSILPAVPNTILDVLWVFTRCLIFNGSIAYLLKKVRQPRYFRAEEKADDFAIKYCSTEGLRTGLESFSDPSVIDTPSHPKTKSRYGKVLSALNERYDRRIYIQRGNNKVYYNYDTPELRLFETKEKFMKYSGFVVDNTKEKYNVLACASFPMYYTITSANVLTDYELIQLLVNHHPFYQAVFLKDRLQNIEQHIEQHSGYVGVYSYCNNDYHIIQLSNTEELKSLTKYR
jgi:hypothetical protein